MDNDSYNLNRYSRLKQSYRFKLGIQQLIIHPLLNLIWLLFGVGTVLVIVVKDKLVNCIEVYPMLKPVFEVCMEILVIIFPLLCAIGIVQVIGYCTAIKDEADMRLVFGDKRDIMNQSPILIYKKNIRKKGVIIREFYTAIPMVRWQEKKDAIADRLDIHILGEMEYGGRNNNIGNHIIIKSAKGRKNMERGVIYDDTF